MSDKSPPKTAKTDRQAQSLTREERLKAALKANMAKRKAQARARLDPAPGSQPDK
ncbi:MAG: hypothetical protein ACT4N9_01970 [Paracoccaceae bacterium]